jgi:hypothetical protein
MLFHKIGALHVPLVAASALLILAGCGGGAGGSTPTPPPPPPVTLATDFTSVSAKTRDDSDGPHLIVMPGGSAVDIIDLAATPNVAGRSCQWSSDLSSVVFADVNLCATTATIAGSSAPGEGLITVALVDNTSVTRSFPVYVNTAQETFAVRNGVRGDANNLNVSTTFQLGSARGAADECGSYLKSDFPEAITGFKTNAVVNTCNLVYDYVFPAGAGERAGDTVRILKPIPGDGSGVSTRFITGIFDDIVLTRGELFVFDEVQQFTGPFQVFAGGRVSNGTAPAQIVDQSGVSPNVRLVFLEVESFTATQIVFRATYQDIQTVYGIYDYVWDLDPNTSTWEHTSRTVPSANDVSDLVDRATIN